MTMNQGKLAGFWGLAFGVMACGSAHANMLGNSFKNIFGVDDRIAFTAHSLPSHQYRAIGAILKGDKICTGALVGPDLVLTAAHCVKDFGPSPLQYSRMKFQVPFIPAGQQNEFEVISGEIGTINTEGNRIEDWALLKLKDKIGLSFGWFGIQAMNFQAALQKGAAYTLIGYSADRLPGASVHVGCSIKFETPSGWLHDCDMTPGSSGGPILAAVPKPGSTEVELKVVGVNVAEIVDMTQPGLTMSQRRQVPLYSPLLSNIAVPAERFVGAVRRALGM